MMTRLDELRELLAYNGWAMQRTFDAVAPLSEEEFGRDLGNSFPSIRATLVHTVGAEWVWLTRWHGTSPTEFPQAAGMTTLDAIRIAWQGIDEARTAWFNALDEAALDREIAYRSFAGVDFSFPLWQMLRHVVNHGSYHRGQVTTMVRQLGHKPISTDMILMYQELQKARIRA